MTGSLSHGEKEEPFDSWNRTPLNGPKEQKEAQRLSIVQVVNTPKTRKTYRENPVDPENELTPQVEVLVEPLCQHLGL